MYIQRERERVMYTTWKIKNLLVHTMLFTVNKYIFYVALNGLRYTVKCNVCFLLFGFDILFSVMD